LEKFKDSFFVKTLKSIKHNPLATLSIVLFDVLFIATVAAFYKLINYLLSKTPAGTSAALLTYYLVLTLLYYLVLILIYSFFKHIIISYIKSFFRKTKIDFRRLKKFYLLNLVIFVAFFTAFLILNTTLLISAKAEYAPYIFLIINFILFLLTYIFMNISHTLFSESEKPSLKKTIKGAFARLTKVKSYIGIFLVNALAVAIYFVMLYLAGHILKATIFSNYTVSLKYSDAYTAIFTLLTTLFFYLIVFFNRIYFYTIIRSRK
jgi:hypothetical protein